MPSDTTELPSSHALYDSRLTPKGIAQSKALREHLAKRPSGSRSFTAFDLVVVSPLTRTCETALHVFGQPRAPGQPSFLSQEVCMFMEKIHVICMHILYELFMSLTYINL